MLVEYSELVAETCCHAAPAFIPTYQPVHNMGGGGAKAGALAGRSAAFAAGASAPPLAVASKKPLYFMTCSLAQWIIRSGSANEPTNALSARRFIAKTLDIGTKSGSCVSFATCPFLPKQHRFQ